MVFTIVAAELLFQLRVVWQWIWHASPTIQKHAILNYGSVFERMFRNYEF